MSWDPDMSGDVGEAQAASPDRELVQLTVAIYQAIGRNLVLLQKMEGLLRAMAMRTGFSGPASQLLKLQKQRDERLRKAGLGDLVGEFTQKVLRAPVSDEAAKEVPDVEEPHVALSVSLESDPLETAARKKCLRRVVEQRNTLVHNITADWAEDSVESCRALLHRLDLQYQEIARELEALASDTKAFLQMSAKIAAWISGGEFQRAFSEALSPQKLESDPN
jgi:hypothetical protein